MSDRRSRPQQRSQAPRQARLPRGRNAPDRPRRISRTEREARRQKQLYLGIGAAALVVVLVLLGTFIWTDVVRPRQTLASVNGHHITRQDYWRARSVSLIDQVNQYQYLASAVGSDQASQYQSAAQNAQQELNGLWGSTGVNKQFLHQMIVDQIYVQNAKSMGITITNDDVNQYTLNQFSSQDAPLIAPTTEPTLIPQRADWATQTAEAQAPAGTPVAAGTPAAPDGIVAATPVAGTPAPDQTGVPVSAAGTPFTSPSPDAAQAQSTAEAGYQQYRSTIFDRAHINESQYHDLVIRPKIARERVNAVLDAQLGQSAPQVHGAHILVATQDLANQIKSELDGGANFAEIARNQSADQATAPQGGDLGWYSQYDVDPTFWQATSTLQPGQISAPFQDASGWHIVLVSETSADRAFTDPQLSAAKHKVEQAWVDGKLADADVSGDITPTATAVPGTFTPPVNAPTAGAETGTPVAGTPSAAGTPMSENIEPIQPATPAA